MKFRLACMLLLPIALSACVTTPTSTLKPGTAVVVPPPPPPGCHDCGRIERIDIVQGVRATAQGGAVLSGIVGGVVSSPEKTATPGAVAQPKPAYRLTVHMDDGRRQVFTQNVISPNLRIGSPVRINDGRVVLLR